MVLRKLKGMAVLRRQTATTHPAAVIAFLDVRKSTAKNRRGPADASLGVRALSGHARRKQTIWGYPSAFRASPMVRQQAAYDITTVDSSSSRHALTTQTAARPIAMAVRCLTCKFGRSSVGLDNRATKQTHGPAGALAHHHHCVLPANTPLTARTRAEIRLAPTARRARLLSLVLRTAQLAHRARTLLPVIPFAPTVLLASPRLPGRMPAATAPTVLLASLLPQVASVPTVLLASTW